MAHCYIHSIVDDPKTINTFRKSEHCRLNRTCLPHPSRTTLIDAYRSVDGLFWVKNSLKNIQSTYMGISGIASSPPIHDTGHCLLFSNQSSIKVTQQCNTEPALQVITISGAYICMWCDFL